MKFAIKQILAVLFCFMLMSEFAIAFERKSRSHKSHHRLSKSHSKRHHSRGDEDKPAEKEYFLNVKNKWFALAAGFFIGLSAGETKWISCLPKAWQKEEPAVTEKKDTDTKADLEKSDGQYKGIAPVLKSIYDIAKTIGKAICWAQKQVISLIKMIIAGVKKFTSRRFRFKERSSIKIQRRVLSNSELNALYARAQMEAAKRGHYAMSKKNMLKIMSWFDSVFDSIEDVFNDAKNAIFSSSDQAYQFVAGKVTMAKDKVKAAMNKMVQDAIAKFPQAVEVFQKIAEYIKALAEQVQKFFQSPLFKRIKELLDCVISLATFASNIKTTITNVITKVKDIVTATGSLPPLALAIIADLILALLCNWEKFAKAIGNFTTASAQTDKIKVFEYWGKGIGGLFEAIGSSETIKNAYDDAISG
jgi:hypothetical protein